MGWGSTPEVRFVLRNYAVRSKKAKRFVLRIINSQYLSYYFNHIAKKQLAKFAKGSTIIHLHYKDIEKAKLLLPSLEEQNRMAKCLVALDKKVSVEQNLLSSLSCQKSYLLQQMFI